MPSYVDTRLRLLLVATCILMQGCLSSAGALSGEYSGTKYFLHDRSTHSYEEMDQLCAEAGEGQLVVIDDEAEYAAVNQMLLDSGSTLGSGVRIGGKFDSLSYTNWGLGQPLDNRPCSSLRWYPHDDSGVTGDFLMISWYCEAASSRFMCERPPQYVEHRGSYKSYDEMNQICADAGEGQLMEIGDEGEYNVVNDMLLNSGSFRGVRLGGKIDSLSYTNWGLGQPLDNRPCSCLRWIPHDDSGLTGDFLMYSWYCDAAFSRFVCEK